MNNEERFVSACSRVDFDKHGFAQTRVWARVTAPKTPGWRRWVFASACAALLFAAGFGVSRWANDPVSSVPASGCAVPAAEPYFLLCVKGGGRSVGYCCKKHSFYREDSSPADDVFLPARRECTQSQHPELPSFYDVSLRQNC